ncbi:MAG: hypothetical protein AB1505_25805 [Candidatus Latescibacterota bacterium]
MPDTVTHTYTAFGLGIHSQVPLPELVPAKATCDIAIQVEEPAPLPASVPADRPWVALVDGEAHFHVPERGSFRVLHGRRIAFAPLPGVPPTALSGLLTGTLMAFLLHQRGFLVLHASCVDVDGTGVAFLGESGWGKSSLAAALHARGHRLVADDVTCVDLSGPGALVRPAYPQLKLAPAAAGAVGIDPEVLQPLNAEAEKKAFRSAAAFASRTTPLRRVYVLDWGPACRFESLGPQAAVIELVRNSYPTRFLCQGGAPHFLRCARLACLATVHRFTRQRSLPDLRRLASRVEDDLAGSPAAG